MADESADVIVVGHGLAGLVATSQIVESGKSVLLIDKQGPADFGGQGLLVLRRTVHGRHPGAEALRSQGLPGVGLAGLAGRGEVHRLPDDHWGRKWAESYVDFASGRNAGG